MPRIEDRDTERRRQREEAPGVCERRATGAHGIEETLVNMMPSGEELLNAYVTSIERPMVVAPAAECSFNSNGIVLRGRRVH